MSPPDGSARAASTASSILSTTPTSFTVEQAFLRGFDDLQFYARIMLAEVMVYDLPREYISIWLMLVNAHSSKERQKVLRFALALPRGFAKTTFIKVLVCWLICYDKVAFALIVCATENLAHNFVADVNDMLSAPNSERIYGNWNTNLAIDSKELKKCNYRRRIIIIAAIGSGTSVRGINIAHGRPDLVICDDMQTKENADSDTESVRLLEWFIGTLLKAVSPFFAMCIYIGNMYVKNCILLKLKENKYWISLVTGCILADGTSLWEELHPIESLYESYKHDEAVGMAHIWFAEMMNDPIMNRVTLLPDGKLPTPPYEKEELVPDAGFLIIDPAGFKKASDDNVITAFLVQGGVPFMVALEAGNFNPLELIHKAVALCHLLSIQIIFIEAVAYQTTLRFWFEQELKRAGLLEHFTFIEVAPKNRAKEGRIRVSIQQLTGVKTEDNSIKPTWYIVDQEARQRYVFQALSYKIGKPNNKDDILDAAAYLEDVRSDHWDLVHSIRLNAPTQALASVVPNNTPF